MNKPRVKREITDRPAPMLPGLYSLQAVSADNYDPDVTVYRMQAKDAADWKQKLVKRKAFGHFLLRHAVDAWDVYDGEGNLQDLCSDVVSQHVKECCYEVQVDRNKFVAEVRHFMRDNGLSLLACAESHSGASAADHSNFVVTCRRMIIDAKPPDMRHLYVVDSKSWPCRVVGVFADVAKLSPAMQDLYLDRLKWLKNSWPMVAQHFRDTLADRLSKARSEYVQSLLQDCGRASGMSEEHILALLTKWSLASPGSKYRFAQHIVDTLKQGLQYEERTAETFDPSYVEKHAATVVKNYRTILR